MTNQWQLRSTPWDVWRVIGIERDAEPPRSDSVSGKFRQVWSAV